VSIGLFFQQLRICIKEKRVDQWYLAVVLSAPAYLNPFQLMEDGELGILLVAELLDSEYLEGDRYRMASEVVGMLGKWFDSTPHPVVRHSWIPTLLGFLSLCEKFYPTESPPHPGFIALHILSAAPRHSDFCEMVLPVLTSTLLPTHPLRSRSLALEVFERFTTEWFSSQVEKIQSKDLNELLRAVGDPFQLPVLSQDGLPVVSTCYKPMMIAIVLIEFASSDLWREHLHHSNFTSCEEVLSTEDGKMAALKCMLDSVTRSWSTLLRRPAKMIMALRRLEDLHCSNTAEVIILLAWTTGVVDPMDHGAWELIGRDTLRFYRTRGIWRLGALSRRITDTTMATTLIELLVKRYGYTSRRVRKPPVPVKQYLRISQACQLRRLYHLFWCDPVAREGGEMLAADGVGAVEGGELICYPYSLSSLGDSRTGSVATH